MTVFDDGSTVDMEVDHTVLALVHPELPCCDYEDTPFDIGDVCSAADIATD